MAVAPVSLAKAYPKRTERRAIRRSALADEKGKYNGAFASPVYGESHDPYQPRHIMSAPGSVTRSQYATSARYNSMKRKRYSAYPWSCSTSTSLPNATLYLPVEAHLMVCHR